MRHLNETQLRAAVEDQELLSPSQLQHLEECGECTRLRLAVAADRELAARLLEEGAGPVDAGAALGRVLARAEVAQGRRHRPGPRRRLRVGLALAAALIGTVSVVGTGVAGNLLAIVQPEQVVALPVTAVDMQGLDALGSFGTFKAIQQPSPRLVADASEAQALFGHPLSRPGWLPSGVSATPIYGAMGQISGAFTFDQALAAQDATAHGRRLVAMPASVNGSTLTVTFGPAAVQVFGHFAPARAFKKGARPADASRASAGTGMGSDSPFNLSDLPQLVLVDAVAPTVHSSGASLREIETYVLAQPGVDSRLAAEIRALGDPLTSLPIPIPADAAATSRVTVHGQQGVFFGDSTGLGAALVWERAGIVHAVLGTMTRDQLLEIANRLG